MSWASGQEPGRAAWCCPKLEALLPVTALRRRVLALHNSPRAAFMPGNNLLQDRAAVIPETCPSGPDHGPSLICKTRRLLLLHGSSTYLPPACWDYFLLAPSPDGSHALFPLGLGCSGGGPRFLPTISRSIFTDCRGKRSTSQRRMHKTQSFWLISSPILGGACSPSISHLHLMGLGWSFLSGVRHSPFKLRMRSGLKSDESGDAMLPGLQAMHFKLSQDKICLSV